MMDTLLDTIKTELDKEQNASKISSLFSNIFFYEKIFVLVIFILLIILTLVELIL